MNKVLVKIIFPKIDKQYDVWLPVNKKVYDAINLLIKGVNELNDGIYQTKEMPSLYNKMSGECYALNIKIEDTNIKNGTELVLI